MITISSLNPVIPTANAGQTITFTVVATDSSSLPLTYEWQISPDGTNYTSSGLTNNTSTSFTTSALTSAQNGLYVRVVVSNGVPADTTRSNEVGDIGDRIITVISLPRIVTQVDSTVDYYPPTVTLQVGQTLTYTVTATLQSADITNQSILSNLAIAWQDSTDGTTFSSITSGGNITITTTIQPFPIITPTTYYKKSVISITNVDYNTYNLRRFRAVISYPNAENTPVELSQSIVYISPQINIFRQPGTGNDTVTSFCYKTAISTSNGVIKSEIGALSTANSVISYSWEYSLDNGTTWGMVADLVSAYNCIYKPGTNATSFKLELERMIYYNTIAFRCIVRGSLGEAPATSNTHVVYMKDVEEPLTIVSPVDIIEDKYGNIPNRETYPESIQRALVEATIDIARNTGLNGDKTLQMERQLPGSSTWDTVGSVYTVPTQDTLVTYTEFPTNSPSDYDVSFTTDPLRRDTDHLTKFRVNVSSSALFNLSGSTKTLVSYYSSVITVNVYRTAYINLQPQDANPFSLSTASFSVDAIPSSGTTISYKWQYNTVNRTTGWIDVPESSPFAGTTTNLLFYTNVPSNPQYKYFRCIISVPNQLSSVTTNAAYLNVRRDIFTFISTLNDENVNQYDNLTLNASAISVSASAVQYQWFKSTNYNPSLPQNATWNLITSPGANTNSYTINSIQVGDAGYYRCRVTSAGGEVGYTNAARINVQAVGITILTNIPTSRTFLEGEDNSYAFECLGLSTIGTNVEYQWEYKSPTGQWSEFGFGYLLSDPTSRRYVPSAFSRSQNNYLIRCRLSAPQVPLDFYTNECTITVNRRFYYFADVATKTVTIGQPLILDLTPTVTGGAPSYLWEMDLNDGVGWRSTGITESEYSVSNVTSAFNNRKYRCLVTLDDCNQHQYTRNGVTTVSAVTPPSAYTLTVTLSTVTTPSRPKYYSQETEKTGAAVGTVICVPKPSDYVHNANATTDDIGQWKVAVSGALTTGSSTVSTITSGTAFNSNKPTWADSSYISPKWILSNDRFKGYLELRGQWVRKSEFPELYRVLGNSYGETTTEFRLPNPYGKKLFGTGNVNNNSGNISIVALYGANGLSGGDKNVPGTIGGVYNYTRSAQLPTGSPGQGGQPDGTAGSTTAPTFTIGNPVTAGFAEISTFIQPSFSGGVTYSIGNDLDTTSRTPSHVHTGVSVGQSSFPARLNACSVSGVDTYPGGTISPEFPETQASFGNIIDGPHGVATPSRSHSHGMTLNGTTDAGNGSANHDSGGNGSGGGSAGVNGNFTYASVGQTISTTELRMLQSSRALFDSSLRFYFRNNESLPLHAASFRLKYMIKAY